MNTEQNPVTSLNKVEQENDYLKLVLKNVMDNEDDHNQLTPVPNSQRHNRRMSVSPSIKESIRLDVSRDDRTRPHHQRASSVYRSRITENPPSSRIIDASPMRMRSSGYLPPVIYYII